MSLPLTFYTTNKGKVAELAAQLAQVGLAVRQDARGYPEVQADTLEEVAQAGADWLLANGATPPFLLEDSGLFVDGLNGFPGVYSRHALDTLGLPGLLALLRGVPASGRAARFEACLLYVDPAGRRHAFTGRCAGRIAEAGTGAGGFGFDPLFVPDGGDGRTFAAMAPGEKAVLGHRGRAVAAFLASLRQTGKP